MVTKRTKTEAGLLEQYRVTFQNVTALPEITASMKDFGYDAKKIAEGKKLFDATQGAFDFRSQEDDETKASRVAFDKCVEEMLIRYRLDRKKAKVIFRTDVAIYAKLELNKSVPQAYVG